MAFAMEMRLTRPQRIAKRTEDATAKAAAQEAKKVAETQARIEKLQAKLPPQAKAPIVQERIVERIVERPVEKIVYRDRPVEDVIEKRVFRTPAEMPIVKEKVGAEVAYQEPKRYIEPQKRATIVSKEKALPPTAAPQASVKRYAAQPVVEAKRRPITEAEWPTPKEYLDYLTGLFAMDYAPTAVSDHEMIFAEAADEARREAATREHMFWPNGQPRIQRKGWVEEVGFDMIEPDIQERQSWFTELWEEGYDSFKGFGLFPKDAEPMPVATHPAFPATTTIYRPTESLRTVADSIFPAEYRTTETKQVTPEPSALQPKPEAERKIPAWGWIAGGVLLLALLKR